PDRYFIAVFFFFFFSSRRRHTRWPRDWSSDVCSSDLWSFVPKESKKPKYVAINADEGEPGTFKDRELIGRDPNRIVEGALITAFAIGSHDVYIYIRGEMFRERDRLLYAVQEAYKRNYAGKNVMGTGWDCEIRVTQGA